MFCYFFDNYSPTENYSPKQIQEIIESKMQVLSFYAKESGQKQCALGLNFDRYDPKDSSVPLLILEKKEVMALSLVGGKKLKKAYKATQTGKDILVIYATPSCKGWFSMCFDLEKFGNHMP